MKTKEVKPKNSVFIKDALVIFGMEIDNNLDSSAHISNVRRKINDQFIVTMRFRNLIPRDTILKVYKQHILPHSYYCSSV